MKQKNSLMKEVKNEVLALEPSVLVNYRNENGNFPVIGEGSHDANIIFIGEAPGKNEAETGRPFCGASGRILDELLDSVSLNREDVYITNIVKDRPPDNRDPAIDEINLYSQFLDRQIEIIKPKIIATLGRFSMEYVLNRFDLVDEIRPISQNHGCVFKTKDNKRIVPLYHPAASIYNQKLKQVLFNDFKALVTKS